MKICWYQTKQIMKVLPDYIHFTVLRFAGINVLWAVGGEWMKPTSKLTVS
ncbi:hypothetical protein YERSI8AC_670002 [Enterobacterales bacterium 8AC]|nr:hypothetical protein YERSI8AC_670002 [Enterobacterales bacterium 8AC]